MKNSSRAKTKTGCYTAKRYDTKMGAIEKKYGVDLGVSPDKQLGKYLKEKGYDSLAKMLKRV